jgi:hypothetical protein
MGSNCGVEAWDAGVEFDGRLTRQIKGEMKE